MDILLLGGGAILVNMAVRDMIYLGDCYIMFPSICVIHMVWL